MIYASITYSEIVTFLNELLKRDADAITRLIEYRVPVNHRLAAHTTVQHAVSDDTGQPKVGLLGILNGFFGTFDEGPRKGWGPISARFDANGHCIGFFLTESC